MKRQIITRISDNLIYKEDTIKNMEYKIKRHKKRFWTNFILAVLSTVMIIVGTYMMITLQTYTKATVTDAMKVEGSQNGDYVAFAEGVLRYSKDGVALISKSGKELWNHPSQLKTPLIDICEESAAVADKGGTDIIVFGKEGVKGEIQTTLPIEKISVSEQGIVAAILKNELSPKVVCYDAVGNVLAEQAVSVKGSGYPMGVDLSADGYKMAVSYLNFQESMMNSTVAFYMFEKEGGKGKEQQLKGDSYEDEIVPMVTFVSDSIAFAMGDKTLFIYEGKENLSLKHTIKIDQTIQNVFHSERYIGLVLQNQQSKQELRLYNYDGQTVLSKNIDSSYDAIKIIDDEIIMYSGNECSIYLKNGIQKFKGKLDGEIREIIPAFGVNKYIVMKADELSVIRLAK